MFVKVFPVDVFGPSEPVIQQEGGRTMIAARCYAEPTSWSGASIVLAADETHHLVDVLRVRPGAEVEVFDGQGRLAQAVLERVERSSEGGPPRPPIRRRAILRIRSVTRSAPTQPPVMLLPAVCKLPRMDDLIEKAVPMGVSVIAPVTTARTVLVDRARSPEHRVARWRRIVLGSAKQCGRLWLPEVRPPAPLEERLADVRGVEVRWVASLEPDARPLREVVERFRSIALGGIAVAVGPEGDFTLEEYRRLRAAAFVPVSLGRTVLRAEMAALYLLCVIRYEFSAAE